MSTEIATIARNLVGRGQKLRERYKAELEKLDATDRYQLAVELGQMTQEKTEQMAFIAQVQKEVIENWADEDFIQMKVDKATAYPETGFITTILPIASIYTESELRKGGAKNRLEATWGESWEDKVGKLMPPWPAEEFLRELAVFSEKHRDWDTAEPILLGRIAERKAASKTKKVSWLTTRDVSKPETVQKRKLRGKKSTAGQQISPPATQESVAINESTVERLTISDAVDEALAAGAESTIEGSTVSDAVEQQLRYESTGAEISSSVDKGKGKEAAASNAEAVGPSNPRKRRRRAGNQIRGQRKYEVDIPVINLDINEGIEELKREAQGQEDEDDALAVERVMVALFGGERPHKVTVMRLLEKVMKVMRAEVVEVEEE